MVVETIYIAVFRLLFGLPEKVSADLCHYLLYVDSSMHPSAEGRIGTTALACLLCNPSTSKTTRLGAS